MRSGDYYRAQAANLGALARKENDPKLKAEFFTLAAGYQRLAEQADINSTLDLTYETPQPSVQQQQQQQQQIQPKPDGKK